MQILNFESKGLLASLDSLLEPFALDFRLKDIMHLTFNASSIVGSF